MSPEILVFGDTAGQADAFFLTASSSDTADEPLKVCQKGGSQVMSKRCKNDAPGMKGCRSRNQNGLLRDKRDDTHMGTVEKQYGRDFGVRSDKHLGNYLKDKGTDSLNDLIAGQ